MKCGENIYASRRHTRYLLTGKTINRERDREREKNDRCIKRFLSVVHTFCCCWSAAWLLISPSAKMNKYNIYFIGFLYGCRTLSQVSRPKISCRWEQKRRRKTKNERNAEYFKCIIFYTYLAFFSLHRIDYLIYRPSIHPSIHNLIALDTILFFRFTLYFIFFFLLHIILMAFVWYKTMKSPLIWLTGYKHTHTPHTAHNFSKERENTSLNDHVFLFSLNHLLFFYYYRIYDINDQQIVYLLLAL